MPRVARLFRDGREEDISADLLIPGDLIIVRAGDRIPADGFVDQGLSFVNEASITGEPLPREKGPADEVFSGSLNGAGLLRIRVSRSGPNTTLARVIELVKEAQEKRAPVERLADRVARYFLPALLLAAALTFYFTRDWSRTVAVLIVACPCALILATPTAMVAAIGGLARRGILVRGAAVLERAARVDTAVFDKTGTITEGNFEIIRIAANGRSESDLLGIAAAAERASQHPLALLIQSEAKRRGVAVPLSESAEVVPGRGARCTVNGRQVLAGNGSLLSESGIQGMGAMLDEADSLGATAVFIAIGDEFAGAILLRDRMREGAVKAVQSLRAIGIANLLMLTGRSKASCRCHRARSGHR